MEQFIPTVAMLALIVKTVDFIRYARAGDANGVVTQLAVWIAGVVVLLLVAQTTWAPEVQIGATPLSKLGFWSLIFAGLSVGSTASLLKDTLKSVDNNNSTIIPTLLPSGPRKSTTTG